MTDTSNGYLSSSSDDRNPSTLILKCIREERIDVLRSILAQLGMAPYFFSNIPLI
uniref:ACT domain-containing protein n=1 Tax=Ascaris lumbricoides TaxID=6252 RepID=A0A0M3I5Z1_ASCLU